MQTELTTLDVAIRAGYHSPNSPKRHLGVSLATQRHESRQHERQRYLAIGMSKLGLNWRQRVLWDEGVDIITI